MIKAIKITFAVIGIVAVCLTVFVVVSLAL